MAGLPIRATMIGHEATFYLVLKLQSALGESCNRLEGRDQGQKPLKDISAGIWTVPYFRELNLAATIDELVPWQGDVPLGALVEVLVANRLLQPKALFRIGQWAQSAALTDYYGLTTEQLNDDRLGRALERFAEHADTIQAALVLKAIERFELDVAQIHYDLTIVELYGAYDAASPEGQPKPTPMPAYGRTKSGRKHVKQVQLGLDVTGDGGVPVGHLSLDGKAAEVTSHMENLKLLARTLPKGKLLYIADTNLDSPKNLLTIAAREGQFLCGGVLLPQLQGRYLEMRDELKVVDYFPQSQAKLAPEERDQYKAVEVAEQIEGEVDEKAVRLEAGIALIRPMFGGETGRWSG
ncbi:IS1634 family transposase (plasmid) [Tundrisphaera lichenicola]|uniref:IS1634 family transposase n=1 Tax=Tundrisphaera lichenicola TaxID=2029860 RepID=UPI003EC07AC3